MRRLSASLISAYMSCAIAAIGSFFAGCVATVLIALLGAPLTKLALAFGPAEYFSLMVLGLIFAVVLAKGSVLKAIAMIAFGVLLSMVGSDIETGASRMSFNIPELADGLGFATVAMGLFGFAEIIRNLDPGASMERSLVQQKITGLMPTKKDIKDSTPAILRGTVLGSILGILPGGGAVIASFAAYTFEKKISKHPQRFGRGAIEGVAAPEAANNAAITATLIPLLTLGIPSNPVMALMIGAICRQGKQVPEPSSSSLGSFASPCALAPISSGPATGAASGPESNRPTLSRISTMTRSAVREGEVTIHGLPVSLDRSTLSAARGDVVVGFRPEAWQVVGAGEPGIDVAVDLVESLGSEAFVHGEPARNHDDATVAIGADRVTFKVIGKTDLDVGDTVRIAPIAEQAHVFDAESGMRLR